MQSLIRSAGVVGLLAGTLGAAGLFPLEPGNTWTYRNLRTGQNLTIRVGDAVQTPDHTYYTLTGFIEEVVYARVTDQQQLVAGDLKSGRETLLTSFAPSGITWWDAGSRGCGQYAQTQDKRVTHEGLIGRLDNVLEVRFRTGICADAGIELEQYADNIGMVRRIVQSFAGPQQYDLIHAQVGGISIDTAPRASFSITVEDDPKSAELVANMRVQVSPATPLKLSFSSGQEFDLSLIDDSGRQVWRWSADKSFLQALHDVEVKGEWSLKASVPRPSRVPGSGAAVYTLQAWLTTIGSVPKFAATVPFTVSDSPAR